MLELTLRRCTREDWAELAMIYPHWARMYHHAFADGSEVWSGFEGDTLLGAAGFLFHAPQQAYAWGAFLTERWPKVPCRLVKTLRAKLREVVCRHGLVRVEAKADCAHVEACGFLEVLGFRCEGLTACSNQYGEDQFLYAYITPEAWEHRAALLRQRYGGYVEQIVAARLQHVTRGVAWSP